MEQQYVKNERDQNIWIEKRKFKKIYKEFVLFAPHRIRKVTIPSFIKNIASHAFTNCKNIEKVEFESEYINWEILDPTTRLKKCRKLILICKQIESDWIFSTIRDKNDLWFWFFSFVCWFLSIPSSIVHLNRCLWKKPKLNIIKIMW